MKPQLYVFTFYAYHSVHRESILKNLQRDDTLYSILLFPVSRSTCFGRGLVDESSTTTAGHTHRLSAPDAVNTV
jgi:hypothetical protein